MLTHVASHLHLQSSRCPPHVTIPSLLFLPVVSFCSHVYPAAGPVLAPRSQMVPNSSSSASPRDLQIIHLSL